MAQEGNNLNGRCPQLPRGYDDFLRLYHVWANILVAALICFLSISSLSSPVSAEEYSFDLSEIEKKPYQLGGYAEARPVLFGLDREASLYKLRFYNRDEGATLEEYNAALQLEGSLEKGISRLFARTNTDYKNSYLGEEQETIVYEGYLSLKPSSSLTIDLGKKTLKWGKGYAWNPAAFVDRPKNPDDPELGLEGFIVVSADYIKSFDGPLKTLSFTPVLIPVYEDVNDDFGETGKVNIAGLMAIPPYFENTEKVRPYFARLRGLRDEIRRQGAANMPVRHLSMGMSHDYEVAVEEGATLIRIGTALFGRRK